jgi:hypothetical protein
MRFMATDIKFVMLEIGPLSVASGSLGDEHEC